MPQATTVNIPNIGPILFEKSKRAKRIIITVKPFKGVRVAVPERLSFKTAQKFFNSQLSWVKETVERTRKFEEDHLSTINNAPKIDKNSARKILLERAKYLAQQNGFIINRIFIRNQKTIWGSCSHQNNINLNINLVNLRPELMDYVIWHELVHTEIKNHSEQFWDKLDGFVGNAKMLDKELGKHRLRLL